MRDHVTQLKSASFPRTWKTDAQYHTSGVELLGTNNIQHTEKIIAVDDRISSDVFIPEIDELKVNFEVRGEYSRQQGHALAKKLDINIIRQVALAARAAADFGVADTETPADRVLNVTTLDTDADVLTAQFWAAAEKLDLASVPTEDRSIVLGPAQYYLLFQSTDKFMINRDYGATGSFQNANLPEIANFKIHKSNHMTAASLGNNYAGVSGENNTYSGDFTDTVAVAFHRSAVGTVLLKDLSMKVVDQPAKYGTLLLASYIAGTSDLRPESAIEFTVTAP